MSRTLATKVRDFRRRSHEEGLGRQVLRVLKPTGVNPRAGRAVIRALKTVAQPVEFVRRAQVSSLPQVGVRITPGIDYLRIPEGSLAGVTELVAHCRGVFAMKRDAVEAENHLPNTDVIKVRPTPAGPEIHDPAELAPIVDFALQPALVAAAARYLGEMPVIGNVNLWYTPVNSNQQNSQLFHRDLDCDPQLGLFVLIDDVDEGAGPFTFVPGDRSAAVVPALNHWGRRVTDEDVLRIAGPGAVQQFTGRAGDALLCNPYRCFHFGGRATHRPRLMLQVRFTSLFCPVEQTGAIYRAVNRGELASASPFRRWLLNLPR